MAQHRSIWKRQFNVPQPWKAMALLTFVGVSVFFVGGWPMCVLGAYIAMTALLELGCWLADRRYRGRAARRKRGLCGKCGYDLFGVPRSPNRPLSGV